MKKIEHLSLDGMHVKDQDPSANMLPHLKEFVVPPNVTSLHIKHMAAIEKIVLNEKIEILELGPGIPKLRSPMKLPLYNFTTKKQSINLYVSNTTHSFNFFD